MIRERHARRPPETTANAVIEGDVVDVLWSLPADAKFDVIIADPPYNIGKDFGNNQDAMPLAAYVDWTREWIAECFERLASDGMLYVYGFPEILARVAAAYSTRPSEGERRRLTGCGAGVGGGAFESWSARRAANAASVQA